MVPEPEDGSGPVPGKIGQCDPGVPGGAGEDKIKNRARVADLARYETKAGFPAPNINKQCKVNQTWGNLLAPYRI